MIFDRIVSSLACVTQRVQPSQWVLGQDAAPLACSEWLLSQALGGRREGLSLAGDGSRDARAGGRLRDRFMAAVVCWG